MTAAPAHAGIVQPSPWVLRFAGLALPGEVLDLACGSGRHAQSFASLGHAVLAVDRDPVALQRVQALQPSPAQAEPAAVPAGSIVTQLVDLETPLAGDDNAAQRETDCHWPFAAARFTAIVVTNYLHRPLLPHLVRSLAPGGVLIYETFAAGNGHFGKPSNPAFLLQPGELLRFALGSTPALRIVAFEDGHVSQPAPAMVQRLCAIRPAITPAFTPGSGEGDTASTPKAQQVRLDGGPAARP